MTRARELAIRSVRGRLQRHASPRLHMFVLVAATAACGLLSSFVLLHAGLRSMALRYPLAMLIAYGAFLGLVALWLRRFRLQARVRTHERGSQVDLDIVDVPIGQLWGGGPPVDAEFGGGGGFSGGGGGASWGEGPVTLGNAGGAPASEGGIDGGGLDFGLDVDEGAVVLIVLAVIAALAFGVVIYVIGAAPALFAELLLDAGLAAGLYKRLLREERRSWLSTAVRSTALPACVVALLLAVAGALMQSTWPDAASIGPVLKHLQEAKRNRPAAHP